MSEEPESESSEPQAAGEDVVVLGQESADGKSVPVVRLREGQVEVGRVQPLEEGKPIAGEVVKLTPRAEAPRICDVEVQYTPPAVRRARAASNVTEPPRPTSGPPQVATDEYRKNWDAIWAQKKKPTELS